MWGSNPHEQMAQPMQQMMPVAHPAQPMMAQPVVGQPIMGQPMMMGQQPMMMGAPPMAQHQFTQPQPSTIVVQQSGPQGQYISEQYVGPVTLIMVIVMLVVFWPAFWTPFLCPCDTRAHVHAPNQILACRAPLKLDVLTLLSARLQDNATSDPKAKNYADTFELDEACGRGPMAR